MQRRTLLRRGAVLAALGLAGCTGGPDDTPTDAEPTDSPTSSSMPETASATPTQTATSTAGSTDTATPGSTASPTATATPDQEVAVGPGGRLRFEPASFEIAAGDTVLWSWDSGGHNVKPSSTPDGSDWTGTSGAEFNTFGMGHTYSYTFEVTGTYQYYCAPHRSSGMTGSFTVG